MSGCIKKVGPAFGFHFNIAANKLDPWCRYILGGYQVAKPVKGSQRKLVDSSFVRRETGSKYPAYVVAIPDGGVRWLHSKCGVVSEYPVATVFPALAVKVSPPWVPVRYNRP